MRLSIHLFDAKIKCQYRRYLAQTDVAVALLFAVLWVETYFTSVAEVRGLLLAVIASTAFVLFALPENRTAHPRNALGGHAVGLLVGASFALVSDGALSLDRAVNADILFVLSAAASVGLSMLLMVATNTEHPPAAGTALGIVFHGLDWQIVLYVAFSIVALVGAHWLLRRRLRNLY
ncbi:MAG: HPP family protein [SAR202 cluster bacterium]|nr:HPP family protein [SAR202 cluster bacterium]